MGLTSAQLRTAWKTYEGAEDKLISASLDGVGILVAPETSEAFEAFAAILNGYHYSVRKADTATYSNRNIANTNKKSLHAYGIALDLNWKTNPIKYNPQSPVRFSSKKSQNARAQDVAAGKADTDMLKSMVYNIRTIRTKEGKRVFEWGGNWQSNIDTMHFEMDLGPSDLKSGINWATVRDASAEDAGQAVAPDFDPASLDTQADNNIVWSTNFEEVHKHIETWEGGFVNHPQDPGGATNFGVTLRTLARWRGHPVSVNDVRTMSINEARRIFYAWYWTPMRVEEIPYPLALMAYNCGVNSGISRSQKFLQKTLNQQGAGLVVDGVVGPKTIAAALSADIARGVQEFSAIYEAFYRSLSHWPTFGKGWMNRLRDITAKASGDSTVQTLTLGRFPQSLGDTVSGVSSSLEPLARPNGNSNTIPTSPISKETNMTTIDTALGGQAMVGKKTLVAGIAFVALMLLEHLSPGSVGEEVRPLLLSIIGTYGGLGALSKFERGNKTETVVVKSSGQDGGGTSTA